MLSATQGGNAIMELDILLPPTTKTLMEKLAFLKDLEDKQQAIIDKATAEKKAFDEKHA